MYNVNRCSQVTKHVEDMLKETATRQTTTAKNALHQRGIERLSPDLQLLLCATSATQSWTGVCEAVLPVFGKCKHNLSYNYPKC
jgi:hypothetical protein